MKFKKETYLKWIPITADKDETYIRNWSGKIVKTRKEHDCWLAQLIGNKYHKIKSGEFAIREHALIDDEWASSYSCMDCMDKFLIENVGLEPEL